MKQQSISRWLKRLVVLLGAVGVIFFGALTVWALELREQQELRWMIIFFSWYTAILCYGILFLFWQVCTEIGRDNSFSMENVRLFHRMALLGIAMAAGYGLRLAVFFVLRLLQWQTALYFLALLLFGGVLAVLCESLSQLVKNAYEVKRENELTI